MDLNKKLEERSKQFEQLVEEKNELERQILVINEELLRIQGEYRLLLDLGAKEPEEK